jgi:CheY-like chemotaxis protein
MSARFSRLKVLLVEDNAVNQQVALAMLSSLGCRAEVAVNGLAAIQALQKQHYDLIFMDVQMPVMDGLEATRRIRLQEGLGRHSRIVAMTAGAFDRDRDECLQAGMDDYATKPIQRSRLTEILLDTVAEVPAAESQQRPAVSATSLGTDALKEPAQRESDPAVLDQLKEELGLPAVNELFDTFIDDVGNIVDGLLAAARTGDSAGLRRLSHTMRSICTIMGALALAAQCKELETEAMTGTLEAAGRRASTIVARYRNLESEIRELRIAS